MRIERVTELIFEMERAIQHAAEALAKATDPNQPLSDFAGIAPVAPIPAWRRFSISRPSYYDTTYQTFRTSKLVTSGQVIYVAAGFGNGLLGGVPGRIADLTGMTTDIIDRDSKEFMAGQIVGTIALVALSFYAGSACGAPLWLSRAVMAIDFATAGLASVSMVQNLATYARTGKLDGTQLFFDALDMLPLISLAGAKAAKAIGGWNCFTPGHIILAGGGAVAGERLLAEALPAEMKTWNIPVLLASGLVVFLSAAQVKRVLRNKRSKDETVASDLIIVKRQLILPDSQFGWI